MQWGTNATIASGGSSTRLINCLSASSVWPGGSGGNSGLWTNGTVTVDKSTFYDSGFSIDEKGKIDVTNSIYARSKERPGTEPLGARPGLTLNNTILWDETTGQGEDPQVLKPSPLWDGKGAAFNSKKFGPANGFFNNATNVPIVRRTPFTPGAVLAEKAKAEAEASAAAAAARKAAKTPEQLALEPAMVPKIENAGFERDLSSWSGAKSPAVEIKTGGASEGQKYATMTSGGGRVEIKGTISGLVEDENYILSFKSRGNTAKDARFILRRDPKSSYLGTATPATTKEWAVKTLKFKTPANEILMEISLRSAGTFDLDDLVIQRAR